MDPSKVRQARLSRFERHQAQLQAEQQQQAAPDVPPPQQQSAIEDSQEAASSNIDVPAPSQQLAAVLKDSEESSSDSDVSGLPTQQSVSQPDSQANPVDAAILTPPKESAVLQQSSAQGASNSPDVLDGQSCRQLIPAPPPMLHGGNPSTVVIQVYNFNNTGGGRAQAQDEQLPPYIQRMLAEFNQKFNQPPAAVEITEDKPSTSSPAVAVVTEAAASAVVDLTDTDDEGPGLSRRNRLQSPSAAGPSRQRSPSPAVAGPSRQRSPSPAVAGSSRQRSPSGAAGPSRQRSPSPDMAFLIDFSSGDDDPFDDDDDFVPPCKMPKPSTGPARSSDIRTRARELLQRGNRLEAQAAFRGQQQPVAQPIVQPAAQQIVQPPAPPAQLIAQPPAQLIAQPPAQLIAQPPAQLIAQPPAQLIAQPPAQLIAQPPAQLIAQPPAQLIAQPPAQLIVQPLAQGANQAALPVQEAGAPPPPPPPYEHDDHPGICKVCLERPYQALLSCGHFFCLVCVNNLKATKRGCAICRKRFRKWTPVFG